MTTPHDLPPLPDIHWAKLSADEWQTISAWGMEAIAPYKARIADLELHATAMNEQARVNMRQMLNLTSRAEKAEAEVAKLRELLAELLTAEKLDDDDPRLIAARLAADTALKGTP